MVTATKDIKKGELAIPLFVRKDGSMICADSKQHKDLVEGKGCWEATVHWVPVMQKGQTDEQSAERTFSVYCSPELNVPKEWDATTQSHKWEPNHSVYLFWLLPRSRTEEEVKKANCTVVKQISTVVCATTAPPGLTN